MMMIIIIIIIIIIINIIDRCLGFLKLELVQVIDETFSEPSSFINVRSW